MSTTRISLSTEQKKVVDYVNGALLVIAGPGSGKTRVLTERIRTLLTTIPEHFRILALTFTNKAADEMRDRLSDLGEEKQRAFVGTLHSFCLEMLSERGNLVGVNGTPHIFEQFKDRKEILLKAISEDPLLEQILDDETDNKSRGLRVDNWLQSISRIKAHPITYAIIEDELDRRIIDAYDAGMRACNAYDFDDLLLLVYRLLTENPKLAEFYRKLYKFICIDESQDLNEAQYAVICALCGDSFKNVMMVGDPKQSIYGFNTSSPKYMEAFRTDFKATVMELNSNYRSSKRVVDFARSLDPNYLVAAQLPVEGLSVVLTGDNEEDEAKLITDSLIYLFENGHPDVETAITPNSCAILGRTRYALLEVEKKLREQQIPFYKRLSSHHENESELVDDFQLALRVIANPLDRLHFAALSKKWKIQESSLVSDAMTTLNEMANACSELKERALAVVAAIKCVFSAESERLNLMPAFLELERFADTLPEVERLLIYEDLIVFRQEWDQYLRSERTSKTISGFMSNKALGSTQRSSKQGVALLTVHSSKGLEFEVVFIAGMAEGSFPDYRATSGAKLQEEKRNAFVAVTRSKRLLFLSYPRTRMMPWGDRKNQAPSQFIRNAGLL